MFHAVSSNFRRWFASRKYDDVVVVNQENVVGADVANVRNLITECATDVSLVSSINGWFLNEEILLS